MKDSEIRLARKNDIGLLPAIERDADALFLGVLEQIGLTRDALDHVCSEQVLEEACRAGRLWVAASSAGDPVGFAVAVELGGYTHLEQLAVHPSHARRGLGGALLEAVCAWARAGHFPAVTLSTFRHIPWNGPFYEKRGFRETAPAMLSDAHVGLVAAEAQRGLRTDLRMIMSRRLGDAVQRVSSTFNSDWSHFK